MTEKRRQSAHPAYLDVEQCTVSAGQPANLAERPTRIGKDEHKNAVKAAVGDMTRKLAERLEVLYADKRFGVLVVVQAMDAAGKDSAIRRCFGPLNPQRCRSYQFRQPSQEETMHDFLWRIHRYTPQRGYMTVFNRSHYESVLVERVKKLVPEQRWRARYEHINNFERMLTDEHTVVVKFYLHVSKGYQRERLLRRLRRPDKRWKFSHNDVAERKYWDEYMRAFEDMFRVCSTEFAPWHIIPSERRWARDYLMVKTLLERIEKLDVRLPQPDIDIESVDIKE